MTAVIHHNPQCGSSRNVLKMIEASGEEILVIECLDTGWSRGKLLALFAGASLTPRTALRVHKSPAEEVGLTDPSVSDEALLDAMLKNPVLVIRPIVVTPKGIRLYRPSEAVIKLLENPHFGVFTKEDGEQIDTRRA
ncbi:MAG: arsenate reductase family protein [Methyloceanibacter sp.]|uniref:arsenate reductase family protein n=1 Tax=Methyloceanibacter sp. TaxID=1965321 RepID=UPI003C356AA1